MASKSFADHPGSPGDPPGAEFNAEASKSSSALIPILTKSACLTCHRRLESFSRRAIIAAQSITIGVQSLKPIL
jgi:hypothetical protein